MPRALWMDRSTFAGHALTVIGSLPEDLRGRLHNLQVVVEDWPSKAQLREAGVDGEDTLYGLYDGQPLTERGADYGLILPDRITLFRGPHLEAADDVAGLLAELRRTVLHELAHHFGIDDDRLQALGAY
ncbi:MAG TPA: metallopeptidase family protein [Anaerolineae bacterium]|nr:metallopeptidase family protein [Anaerolineae bacterium]